MNKSKLRELVEHMIKLSGEYMVSGDIAPYDFAGGIIECLDGPEQRAAFAEDDARAALEAPGAPVQGEREAFEAWLEINSEFNDMFVECNWDVWQAALKWERTKP